MVARIETWELERQSKKATKEETAEKAKLKKALQAGNTEVARIHAANAIRKKNESLHALALASRIDALASRVQSMVSMRSLGTGMLKIVGQMDQALRTMDVDRMGGMIDAFEAQCDALQETNVQSSSTNAPLDQIDGLLQQVADENGLELNLVLSGPPKTTPRKESDKDSLLERFQALKPVSEAPP